MSSPRQAREGYGAVPEIRVLAAVETGTRNDLEFWRGAFGFPVGGSKILLATQVNDLE